MFHRLTALARCTAALALAMPLASQAVYLNNQNSSVSLGAGMAAEPFANRSAAASLASVIDAPSADAFEKHNQSTHVWVSGGRLELVFDFGVAYDLNTFHFWNYHSEGFDVDNIDLTFFDASENFVGTLLGVKPSLGGTATNDSTEIYAENSALAFPTRIRYVSAVLSGSNNQVDFNNIGFTGTVSAPVPEPATWGLMLAGLGVAGLAARRRRR